MKKYSEIGVTLKALTDNLGNANMQELNNRVNVGHNAGTKVA